jgi:tetratricopeptide (TPR) repeat protein
MVARQALLEQARTRFDQVLALDPENATAHYNLALVYTGLDQPEQAARHRRLHDKYRTDDQAIERAVTRHRRSNPAANHAAEAVAIYDLRQAESPDRTAATLATQTHGMKDNHVQ